MIDFNEVDLIQFLRDEGVEVKTAEILEDTENQLVIKVTF